MIEVLTPLQSWATLILVFGFVGALVYIAFLAGRL